MIARNVEPRIVRLEARSARPGEMLVVWRLPGCDVAEGLKDATFAKGDKVICAEWFAAGALQLMSGSQVSSMELHLDFAVAYWGLTK